MSKEQLQKTVDNAYRVIIFALASICVYFLKMQLDELKSMRNDLVEVKQWEAIDKMQHSGFIENDTKLTTEVAEHEKIIQKNIHLKRLIN